MHVARGDHGQAALGDFVKKIGAAGNFPGVELGGEFLAAVPEVISLFLALAGPDRVSGDRESSGGANRASEMERVLGCGNEFVYVDGQHVCRALVANRVLGQLESGQHDHAITVPSALGFGFQDRGVHRVARASECVANVAGRFADQGFVFDEVIGDRDDPKTSGAEEIDQFGNRKLPVAER